MKCHKCSSFDLRQDIICNTCGEVVFFKEPVLKWTKEKPNQSGFYFIKSLLENPQPCRIVDVGENVLYVTFIGDEQNYTLKGLHDGYKFCGPIPIP